MIFRQLDYYFAALFRTDFPMATILATLSTIELLHLFLELNLTPNVY